MFTGRSREYAYATESNGKGSEEAVRLTVHSAAGRTTMDRQTDGVSIVTDAPQSTTYSPRRRVTTSAVRHGENSIGHQHEQEVAIANRTTRSRLLQ